MSDVKNKRTDANFKLWVEIMPKFNKWLSSQCKMKGFHEDEFETLSSDTMMLFVQSYRTGCGYEPLTYAKLKYNYALREKYGDDVKHGLTYYNHRNQLVRNKKNNVNDKECSFEHLASKIGISVISIDSMLDNVNDGDGDEDSMTETYLNLTYENDPTDNLDGKSKITEVFSEAREELQNVMVKMYVDGLSRSQAATELGLCKVNVHRWIKKAAKTYSDKRTVKASKIVKTPRVVYSDIFLFTSIKDIQAAASVRPDAVFIQFWEPYPGYRKHLHKQIELFDREALAAVTPPVPVKTPAVYPVQFIGQTVIPKPRRRKVFDNSANQMSFGFG